MRYSPKQYAQALYDSLKDVKEGEIDLIFKNFYSILLRNNDLKLINKIIEKIKEIDKEERGVVEVEVTGAKEIDKDLVSKLCNLIGKKAEIQKKVDPGLIGGLKIQINDLLIDGSIKAKLNKLKQSLI
jgi:F-type H+-transporting ATPase subunit delta